MLIQKLLGGHLGLHSRKLVSLGFETRHNVSNDSTLNTIGLDLQFKDTAQMNDSTETPPGRFTASSHIVAIQPAPTHHDVSSLHGHGKGTIRPHTPSERGDRSKCVGSGNDGCKDGGDLHD